MASNQVQDYRVARDALKDAVEARANPTDIATLRAAANAAKALTPGGKGGGSGILD